MPRARSSSSFQTVTDNATIEGIEIIALTPNNPPAIATPAAATPNPVSGTTASLSALGDDDGGEASLTYTWATTGTPPAAVTFSANGTNAAKNTIATFGKAGNYTLQVAVRDAPGLTTTSQVAVTVDQTLTSIVVAPTSSTIDPLATQQFAATARDQFTTALTTQPTFAWSVSGGGTIDATGQFTAATSGGGPYTVTATSGAVSGTATVSVTVPNDPPTIGTPAAATPSPVTGTTTALSVLGADDGGEANLTYTWATTGTPPAGVAFSANGTNAAKNTTATFTKAGVYTLQVTVRDQPGLTATSQVAVTVDQTLTSIVVSPASASVNTSATQQFTATARDQFATALGTQPSFTWTVSGGGTISSAGLFTAGSTAGGPFTVTAASGGVNGTASVTVTAVNAAPTIATAAAASPSPVTGTTTALSVLGADDGGEANLTYTWATTGTPPASVSFSANGTNAAKNTTATFTKAGSYSFQVTVRDQSALTATSSVTVTVNQTLTSIVVSPASASVNTSATQQFTATARDQFATALGTQPSFTWTVSGGGTISSAGLFTAGSTAGGPFTVTAASGGVNGTASVTVTAVNAAPTIATAAAASPSPVTGTTTALSVLGADDGGEANLTYTWATTGTPPAAVSFSANGTNAAKNTTATFTKAGSYSFQVTVRDQSALTATSSVTVTVNQTLTSIVVAPSSASVATAATQQFTATARDQFTTNLGTQPSFTWTVSGGGTISSAGLFTAGSTAGGPYTVTAASGGKSGTASVTVTGGGSTPCAGLCTSPVVFTTQNYQSGNIGTGATCHETTANLIGGNCSNISSRTLKVNNTTMSCNGWALPAKRNGGYCIQVTAGEPSWTSFATW